MSGSVQGGPVTWRGGRDEEGFREYFITHRVKMTDEGDGPALALQASGLPATGSFWSFDNDVDIWAFCSPEKTQKIYKEKRGDPNLWWDVESRFTTKPFNRCQTSTIEDPLLEPQKISGSFVKFTKEAIVDKDGNGVFSSSEEMFRGPQVEIDDNRPTVRIEQNVLNLGLATFAPMVDTVNDAALWGLPARTIKLSNVSWQRKYFGTCSKYYTRIFDFDIDFNTFDRTIIDEGTKVKVGHWTDCETWTVGSVVSGTGTTGASGFQRFKDCKGENIRTLLDGSGNPNFTGTPVLKTFKFYSESNFPTLAIPLSL